MSDVPSLFYDQADIAVEGKVESRSVASKIILLSLTTGLVVAFGAIAYFGIGPMLVKPYEPPVQSNAPDVSDVLGLHNSQQGSGITAVTNEQVKQLLLKRLATEVEIADNEEIAVMVIEKVPQHDSGSLFAQAAPNDVLFILKQNKSAYLYRPAEDKIIATGSVSL
jgi:hypothetical protein